MAFDSTRGIESIAMCFIVNRPANEPGFGLVRQEANGRTMRYTRAQLRHRQARSATLLRRAMQRIAPSILSADFARLGDEVRQRHRRRRRLDSLRRDGQPLRAEPDHRPGGGAGDQAALRARRRQPVPLDVHLMVQPVDALAQAFAQAGADLISFHPEASRRTSTARCS